MEKIKPTFFLEANNILLGYQKNSPISETPFSFQLPQGAVTALVGPNGSENQHFLRHSLARTHLSRVNWFVTVSTLKKCLREIFRMSFL